VIAFQTYMSLLYMNTDPAQLKIVVVPGLSLMINQIQMASFEKKHLNIICHAKANFSENGANRYLNVMHVFLIAGIDNL